MFKFSGLAAAAAVAMALMFSAAAPSQAHAQALVSDWGVDDMSAVATELGYKITKSGLDSDGRPYINLETTGGLKFRFNGAACDKAAKPRCRGMEMAASFTLESAAEVDSMIHKIDYVAVSVGPGSRPEVLLITRYMIFDYGVAPKNLRLNIGVFVGIVERIQDGKLDFNA